MQNNYGIVATLNIVLIMLNGLFDIVDTLKNDILSRLRRCKNCGKILPEEKTFCEWCGIENE